MKTIYLIGFRGAGIRPQYQEEDGLILLGHVGIMFEDNREQILDFHPTADAISRFENAQAALRWLRDRKLLDGCLQDDTAIFKRAHELSQDNPHLTVWEYPIDVNEEVFASIKEKTLQWYNEGKIFPYGLPAKDQTWDNCATFPRQLGISLPEETGSLYLYIAELKQKGHAWKPEED